jgi:hypothetical protein
MFPMLTAIPQAGADNGLPIALAVALAATALAAIGMTVVAKFMSAWKNDARLARTVVGIGAGSALALLVGALIVGGALTRPPAAVADEPAGKVPGHGPVETKVEGFQLPTL